MDRWETPFGAWVLKYGTGRIRRALQVTRSAVHQWVAGRVRPHPEKAEAIVKLSAGTLSLEQVFEQYKLARIHWLKGKEA